MGPDLPGMRVALKPILDAYSLYMGDILLSPPWPDVILKQTPIDFLGQQAAPLWRILFHESVD